MSVGRKALTKHQGGDSNIVHSDEREVLFDSIPTPSNGTPGRKAFMDPGSSAGGRERVESKRGRSSLERYADDDDFSLHNHATGKYSNTGLVPGKFSLPLTPISRGSRSAAVQDPERIGQSPSNNSPTDISPTASRYRSRHDQTYRPAGTVVSSWKAEASNVSRETSTATRKSARVRKPASRADSVEYPPEKKTKR